jgi:outer membrane biosynthesis protein TonB
LQQASKKPAFASNKPAKSQLLSAKSQLLSAKSQQKASFCPQKASFCQQKASKNQKPAVADPKGTESGATTRISALKSPTPLERKVGRPPRYPPYNRRPHWSGKWGDHPDIRPTIADPIEWKVE